MLTLREEDSNTIKIKDDFCGKPMAWSHYDIKTTLSLLQQAGLDKIFSYNEKNYGSNESHIWMLLRKVKKLLCK